MSTRVRFVTKLNEKRVGLTTTNSPQPDFYIYVNPIFVESCIEQDVLKKWSRLLIDGEGHKEDVVLKLSIDTELRYVAESNSFFFNAYGSGGWYVAKYIPREVHQSIYTWLVSNKRPDPPKAATPPEPIEPRRSKRARNNVNRYPL